MLEPHTSDSTHGQGLRRHWPLLVISFLILGVSVACSSSGDDGGVDSSSDPVRVEPAVESSTTTTTIANRPPEVRAPSSVRAEIGQTWSDAIVVIDPDGDQTTVEVDNEPRGFQPVQNARGLITGFEWSPTEAGEWTVTVRASDPDGLQNESEVRLIARHPHDGDALLAMGGAVAAGFGRDRSDFISSDECWRGEATAHPTIVHDQLVVAGALDPSSSVGIVACSGHMVADLSVLRVTQTNGSADRVGSEERTQLDWAIRSNPTIITLMIGAADAHLVDPTPLLLAGAGQNAQAALDAELLNSRLSVFEDGLDDLLGTLLISTDAHVAVATWYNPAGIDSVGVEGCDRFCFRTVSDEVIDALNDRLEAVVARHSEQRVTLVDLTDVTVGREAPNGLGPDALRENGFGPLQGLADRFTGGRSPWCADDSGPVDTVISRLDCVHPNEDGQQAIAERVAQALLDL